MPYQLIQIARCGRYTGPMRATRSPAVGLKLASVISVVTDSVRSVHDAEASTETASANLRTYVEKACVMWSDSPWALRERVGSRILLASVRIRLTSRS